MVNASVNRTSSEDVVMLVRVVIMASLIVNLVIVRLMQPTVTLLVVIVFVLVMLKELIAKNVPQTHSVMIDILGVKSASVTLPGSEMVICSVI